MKGNERESIGTVTNGTGTRTRPIIGYLPLLIAVVAGTVIRIYRVYTGPIYMDENFYSFDSYLLEGGLAPFSDFPTRSPLMILIGAGILRTGGDFYTLRLAAVAASVATGVLIYLTGRLMAGNRVGTLAACLFLLSPYSIRYGYVYFTQPFEVFLVGLSFYLLVRWIGDTATYRDRWSGEGGPETSRAGGDPGEGSPEERPGSVGAEIRSPHDADPGSESTPTSQPDPHPQPMPDPHPQPMPDPHPQPMPGPHPPPMSGPHPPPMPGPQPKTGNRSLGNLVASGIVLGLAVFLRRNAIAFFPAGLLTIALYQILLRDGSFRGPALRKDSDGPWYRPIIRGPEPLLAFTLGFLGILLPGIMIFIRITGLSFTTYFFFTDYFEARSGIYMNTLSIFLYMDTRAYHFISLGMILLTIFLLRAPDVLSDHFGVSPAVRRITGTVMKAAVLCGWAMASLALLGNNYRDGMTGDAIRGTISGVILLGLTAGWLVWPLRRRETGGGGLPVHGSSPDQCVARAGNPRPDEPAAIRGSNPAAICGSNPAAIRGSNPSAIRVAMHGVIVTDLNTSHFTTILIAILIGIPATIILMSGPDYFLPFGAVILLNVTATFLLFTTGGMERRIRFSGHSATGFPFPYAAPSVFFVAILAFYLLFRIILPYFYDMLFPLCIVSALLLQDIRGMDPERSRRVFETARVLLVMTLVLSPVVSVMEYRHRDAKMNDTDLEEFEGTVQFLRGATYPGEVIFTAKGAIAVQAGVNTLFNIVRPVPYRTNDTRLIEKLNYPTIQEIISGLHERAIRFIVVDWVMQTYFLDPHPELNHYVTRNYAVAVTHGGISVMQRI